MCARYVIDRRGVDLAKLFEAEVWADTEPSYNIAPTQQAPVLLRSRRDGSRRIEALRWGFLAPWAADNEGAKLVNIRSETLLSKPAFADAARGRRCAVPVRGWYEWTRTGRHAQPHFITHAGAATAPLLMAGVWTHRRTAAGVLLVTYAILTRASCGPLEALHDRMPVVLERDIAEAWIEPRELADAEVDAMVRQARVEAFGSHPVSPVVNSPRSDGPELIEPLVLLA